MTDRSFPGSLVLVVGPSGAGKDSLLRYAADALRNDDRFVFPRRVITRPCDGRSELHDSMSEDEFERASRAGAFALHWRAHGFSYGIPASIEPALGMGQTVAVNVSRGIIAEAVARYAACLVVHVTARPDVIAARLAARGREAENAIARRIIREAAALPAEATVIAVENNADLRSAGEQLLHILLNTFAAPQARAV